MRNRTTTIGWSLATLSSVGVALYTYHYLFPHPFVPPNVKTNPMADPWLTVHASFAATAMLTGPFQFLHRLRSRVPRVHRWTGRIYVASCFVGGIAGFILAFGSTAGPLAQAGFALLAAFWLTTTAMAWRHALGRRYPEHRRWMIRSFALTFAAVTLRLYIPLSATLGLPGMDSYVAVMLDTESHCCGALPRR